MTTVLEVGIQHNYIYGNKEERISDISIQSLQQGVVTYMLPVEAFATGIKIFDWQKVCLIA